MRNRISELVIGVIRHTPLAWDSSGRCDAPWRSSSDLAVTDRKIN